MCKWIGLIISGLLVMAFPYHSYAEDIEIGSKITKITSLGSLAFGMSEEELRSRGYKQDEAVPSSWSGKTDFVCVGDDYLEGASSAATFEGEVYFITIAFEFTNFKLARKLFEDIEDELRRSYKPKITRYKDRGIVFMDTLNDSENNSIVLTISPFGRYKRRVELSAISHNASKVPAGG